MKKFYILLSLFPLMNLKAQDVQKQPIKLSENVSMQLGGFIRVDAFHDSRLNSDATEGAFLIYPLAKQNDAWGNDKNAVSSANITALASRLSAKFFGPDVLGAQTSALLEFEFSGSSSGTSSLSKLRHAWAKLSWPQHELLMGRTWHPMFSTSIMPAVISLNTGSPFVVFNRSEQIRYSYKPGIITLTAAAAYQTDYQSYGQGSKGESVKSMTYQRKANLPDLSFVAEYNANGLTAGFAANYKRIKPADSIAVHSAGAPLNSKIKTDVNMGSASAMFFAKYQHGLLTAMANGLFAQNMGESLMPGGYALIKNRTTINNEEYSPTNHIITWANIVYGKQWEFSLFAGYLKNLGTSAKTTLSGYFYGRSNDIDHLYRISTHVKYAVGRIQICPEIEYTSVAYGKVDYSNHMKVTNTYNVSNTRFLLVSFFNF
jgi:hypothetical protein